MDRRTLTRDEALEIVRHYKHVVTHRYQSEPNMGEKTKCMEG